jgi:type III secretion protein R
MMPTSIFSPIFGSHLPLIAAVTPSPESLPNPVVMVIILGALTLAPFVLIMLTSFVKISVVLSILRNALGTQSVPPNQVITGLAFILSLFVMTPVAKQMYNAAGSISDTREMFSEASVKNVFDAIQHGREPLRHFLAKHAHDQDRVLFIELANRLDRESDTNRPKAAVNGAPVSQPALVPVSNPPVTPNTATSQNSSDANAHSVNKNDFQVLIPAFVTSQLKEAFEIGFLVFVPFIIIDMVIANILLAMGMSMLSPSVISLPFKLLLFVLVDGWYLIIRGLVLSYV